MSMFYLKKPSYSGRRFVSIDETSAIFLRAGNKYYPLLTLLILTGIGVFVSIRISMDSFGLDQSIAIVFWITVIYLWIRLMNMPVEMSLKENRIFFSDYLSNIKYMLIPDLLSIEQKKSIITIISKSDKIKIQSAFDGISEMVEELKKKNPQINVIGFS